MSQNMLSLEFENHAVRIVTSAFGEKLFVGKDVCEVLGYADPTTAMRSHCRGVQILHPIPDSLGREQDTRVITRSDVMRLICGSTLPAAVRFDSWVFDEILPSIADTGSYVAPNAPVPAVASPSLIYLEQSVELLQQSSEVNFNEMRSVRRELDEFYDSLPQKMENIFNAASGKYAAEMKGVEMLLEAADRRVQALERLVSRLEKRLDRLEDRAAA